MVDRVELLRREIAEIREWLYRHGDTAPVRVAALAQIEVWKLEQALQHQQRGHMRNDEGDGTISTYTWFT